MGGRRGKQQEGSANETSQRSFSNQITANIGLFHVCYELSRRGFNVVPTSRNTRAVDLIVGSADFRHHATIQVKAKSVSKSHEIGPVKKFPTIEEVIAETSLADFWVSVLLNPECGNAVAGVAVWKGGDRDMPRKSGTIWKYYPWNLPKDVPEHVRNKWENQKNDKGWALIENFLNGKT